MKRASIIEERIMDYQPFCNTEISFSNRQELAQTLLSLDETNIVLIMHEDLASKSKLLAFIEDLKTRCLSLKGSFTWINKLASNPTQKDILVSLQQIGNQKVDTIIACGGGSSIDLAKGISLFYNSESNERYKLYDITKSIKSKKYEKTQFIDIIAVPSTAGTGSELTQWATIWDENKTGKFSIDHPMLKPQKTIIVPELTLSLPPLMTLATGLDAMCHAIESYWSKYTTPLVQEIAYRAVELIIANLRNAVDEPNNNTIREKLCRASVLAGLAFSQTRTTACHSISYPLTILYNIPHGLAASITLDEVGQINKGNFPNDTELFALFSQYKGIQKWIDSICDGVINLRLSSYGISPKDIPFIADNAFTEGRMDNNPVDLSKDDVINILESVI
jgi:alcohol dehydrogenase class IV